MRTLLLVLTVLSAGCASSGRTEAHVLPRHFVAVLEECEGAQTRVVRAPFACAELVPSWNLDVPPGTGVVLELAVARGDGGWSPWLVVGSWGLEPASVAELRGELERRTRCSLGRVEVDTFVAAASIDRARLRARVVRGSAEGVRLRRAAFCFTSSSGSPSTPGEPVVLDRGGAAPSLAVPFRSQRWEAPELAARICSPTSLAMVLAFHGVERPTDEVAAFAHDPLHDVYGNWSRAVQTAWSYGLPGHVARFSAWRDVARLLAAGMPLVASVRVDAGQLAGAPFASSEGHLLVIRGLDADGFVLVCDPAFATEAEGATRYSRTQLEDVWLRNRKGTAYLLEPPVTSSGR